MTPHKPLFRHITWLRIEHIVAAKLGLSAALLAAYVLPHPWSLVVGAASNMIWVWRF